MTNPKRLCVAALGLLLMISFVPSARSSPPTTASSPDGAEATIENIHPVKTVRGYLSGNSDNTYFPGDFAEAEVSVKSAGKRGVAVTDRWKRYDKKWKINHEEPWYGGMKTVDDKKWGQWYASKENARGRADEKKEQSDIIDSGVKRHCTDWDYRAWWIYEGEDTKKYSKWYERATDAAFKRNQMEAKENVEETGIGSEVDKSSCSWRPWWIDRDWKIELLKLKPLAQVRLYNATGGGTNVEVDPQEIEMEEGEYVAKDVTITLKTDTSPGRYAFEVEMTPPSRGHNNPYKDVEPFSVADNLPVVPYDPAVRRIPYLAYHWKPEQTGWMIQKPGTIVTRYDGSKCENGRLSLDRRVVVSGISVSGGITKPLRANDLYLRVNDNEIPTWSRGEGQLRLSLEEGNLSLAKDARGDYRASGSIVSPVFDAEDFAGDSDATWEEWSVKKETPDHTGVKVYIKTGNRVERGEVGGEWTPLEDVEEGDDSPDRRYFQYWIVLYTSSDGVSPKVKKFSSSSDDPSEEWNISSWEDGRTEGPSEASPSHFNYFCSNRHTGVWRPGEVMTKEQGVPETGTLKVTPLRVDTRAFPHTPIVLELKPQELSSRLQGKTDTLERAPSRARLILQDVVLFRSVKEDGEKVFLFAPGETRPGGYYVKEETSFRYGAENRYRKWRFFFHPDWSTATLYRPSFVEWFEDATVGIKAGFWFHQQLSQGGRLGRGTLRRAFETEMEWEPISDHQSIRIAAWELKGWAERELSENPRIVLEDGAWEVDRRVKFRYRFDSMESPENFLRSTKDIAKRLENRGENLNLERSFDVVSDIGKIMENYGIEEPAMEVAEPDVGVFKERLRSLAYADNRMIQMILKDIKPRDNGPQVFEGRGSLIDNVKYRIGGYFALHESAWIFEDNVRSKNKMIQLTFDPSSTENFNINFTGEGLAAEVVDDGPNTATVRIYDPPRSGGIQHVAVYDNQGNLLMEENFHSVVSGMVQFLSGSKESWPEFGISKEKRTPTELVLKMTNTWGGTTTQTIHISPGESPGLVGIGMSWKWVVIGIFAMMAWVALVRHLGGKKRGKQGGTT